jgi:hypothetical protein
MRILGNQTLPARIPIFNKISLLATSIELATIIHGVTER